MKAREIREMVEGIGLTLVSLDGNKHWKATVRNTSGREATVIFPRSMGDCHRGFKNKIAQLRQVARGA